MKVRLFVCLFLAYISLSACGNDAKQSGNTDSANTKREFVMPSVPSDLTNPSDRAGYLVEHYWDNFDFADTALIHLPEITEQAMADYVAILSLTKKETTIQSIRNSLLMAQKTPPMYNYFLEMYRKYLYDPNSPMKREEFYLPVLDYIIENKETLDSDRSRAEYERKMLLRNQIGAVASDFTYIMKNGKSGNLHNLKADHLLILFYNPDCHSCIEGVNQIKSSAAISKALEKKSLAILAVYPDSNIELWKKYYPEIPETWINVYDKERIIETKELYDLKATPTIYLLDKDKKVMLKDAIVGEIENLIQEQF